MHGSLRRNASKLDLEGTGISGLTVVNQVLKVQDMSGLFSMESMELRTMLNQDYFPTGGPKISI